MSRYKKIAEAIELTVAHTSKWAHNYNDMRRIVSSWKRELQESEMSKVYEHAITVAEEFEGEGYTHDEAMEQICQEKDGYVQKVIEENIELKEKVCQLQKRGLCLQKQLSDALKKK